MQQLLMIEDDARLAQNVRLVGPDCLHAVECPLHAGSVALGQRITSGGQYGEKRQRDDG